MAFELLTESAALSWLDYAGVFVFAASGALLASRKNMDVFGMLVLALLPAVGGGTVRDLLLDVPVFWIEDNTYVFITMAAVVLVFTAQKLITQRERLLMWADAIGLAVFCVLGTAKATSVGTTMPVAVIMGVITAVVGGMLRDVVANEIPYILQREIYATAALAGAVSFVVLTMMGLSYAEWISISVALLARALGITRGWSLPRPGV